MVEEAGREQPVGGEHRKAEVALALEQRLLRAGCVGTALGCALSAAALSTGVGAVAPKPRAPTA